MTGRSTTERILDAYLAPEADRLPDRVVDAALADIARTRQRRRLPVPWRFPPMPKALRLATAALVGVIAVGVIYLNLPGPNGTGGQSPSPSPSPSSTVAPSPSPSEIAPGIIAWTTYTSEIYEFDFGYPDDWTVGSSATREWQAGDTFEESAYKEGVVGPDAGGVALAVWRMPVAASADVGTLEGLKAWAEAACNELVTLCDDLPGPALPMCLGQLVCSPALIVPNENIQVAFIAHPSIERVTVVMIGRPDTHPSVARYGGSVELLKSILTTMDVWTPEPGQTPG